MIINIIKDPSLFENLSQYNPLIVRGMEGWKFNEPGQEYDFNNKIISKWFDPTNVRNLGLSRTYPYMCSVQYRREYCLYLHCSNYLILFLLNLLYQDRKDILIEDIGGGAGWLFLYLSKLGFYNFHLWDNFSQLTKECAEEFLQRNNLSCQINNPQLEPVITNNVGIPEPGLITKFNPKLELICCYINRNLEKYAQEHFSETGFIFLCRESDELAFAYCRKDKYEEFNQKLLPYKDE